MDNHKCIKDSYIRILVNKDESLSIASESLSEVVSIIVIIRVSVGLIKV